MTQSKFFISKLKDGSCLAWSSLKGAYSKRWIYMEHFNIFDNFKDNYNDFKITDKAHNLTKDHQVIKLNF